MKIEITEVVQLPLEADEAPGMPTFRVTGKVDKKDFEVHTSVEIDGRDVEHDSVSGVDVTDYKICEIYFEALCENKDFIELSEKAAKEFYENSDC